MSNCNAKQLVMVGRIGPAFGPNEIQESHAVLDRCGVPRRLKGAGLSLPERISFLNGMLASARSAARRKQIFVISKREFEAAIKEEYSEIGAESGSGQHAGEMKAGGGALRNS